MSGTVEKTLKPENAIAYSIDTDKRHYLTTENIRELGLTWDMLKPLVEAEGGLNILNPDDKKFSRRTQSKDDKKSKSLIPDGISINGVKFGNYPDSIPAADKLGWITYMVIGEPLIEESANIIPPAADLLSTRSYVNRGKNTTDFQDSVKFSISNTISWSLQGSGTLTFGGSTSGTTEGQQQDSSQFTFQASAQVKHINHDHKDNVGTQEETSGTTTKAASATSTATGTASGTGELSSQLALGITGSASGSLTTSWESTSTVSGKIPVKSRVETMATQRRQIKKFTYEVPVTLSGFISLHYPEPVLIDTNYIPPQDAPESKDLEKREGEKYSEYIAYDIGKLSLYGDNSFLRKGIAEIVSALNVEHTVFEEDDLNNYDYPLTLKRPRNN